ncbi:DUF58 domain-containing protein [Luteimonas dalianensis]|uniref:DUF58 domain-containing protein n=1 Tax=Luteimonas dalianensis TaxID=1148196 RepID=UPI003BF2F710
MAWDPIPPEVRARLRTLRIGSRRAAGGRGFGLHRSRSRGAGMEFVQYRGYEPGDELRRIDWKLYARSDRFFVREAERESQLTIWVLLDMSASMAQADEERPDWSRLDAAKALAASMFEIALAQGDPFGLVLAGDGRLSLLPAAAGIRQRDRLLMALEDAGARGGPVAPERLAPLWQRVGPEDVVVLLGDFFDETTATLAERLAAARREVLAIQLLTVGERDFDFGDGRLFRDPETGDELPGDGPAMREGFLERFGQARRELQARFNAVGIRHVEYVLDEPLDLPLRRLLGGADAAERP